MRGLLVMQQGEAAWQEGPSVKQREYVESGIPKPPAPVGRSPR